MADITIQLKPVLQSNEYAIPHIVSISKADNAGKPITFTAEDSGLAIVIPKNCDGKILFVENAGVDVDPWYCSIRPLTKIETPNIKASNELNVNDEWVYYIYCEKTQNWVDKIDSSPPRIIVVP